MALDRLIATLESRGAAEVAEIVGAAREEALAMARDARARHEQWRAEAETMRERELRSRANAATAEAQRASTQLVLQARAATIDRVWRMVRDQLGELQTRKRVAKVVGSHVREALPYLEGMDSIVRCSPDLTEEVRAALKQHDSAVLVKPDPDLPGIGVIVSSADGTIVIDNTLQARLARLRPWLTVEIAERLAGLTDQLEE